MNLKELTKENHKNAERQEFVKHLLSGSIDHDLYATYLFNQFPQYEILEVCSMQYGLFNDFPQIIRSKAIREDFHELWQHDKNPELCPVVQEYLDHIMKIKSDPEKLMAHIYVRHMGDLSGGQMISKKIPGEGRFYKFDGEVEDIKNKIREKLDNSMADEAKVCFDFATKLFQEMMTFVK